MTFASNMKWLLGFQRYFLLLSKKNILPVRLNSCYLGKWEPPQGYETGISIYNSASNKKVPLILRNKGLASWYVCGPTVYDESHIGHASCYVKFDTIRRIMENVFGIHVLLLMGITDIDDKIIKKSVEVGLDSLDVSRKYEFEFLEDMSTMQVIPPTAVSRVTDNISCIISFCEKLIEKGYAYVTDEGNVYFMVTKSISSAVLSDLPEESQSIIDPLKRDKRDFALWKAAKANEPFWISPWGKGRPGWHIECSAMASKMFGSHLDLHSGGYDLLFPHHSNEKSQSEAYHDCSQWGNYWLHSGLLQIGEGVKMSKSIKNTISIKEFLQENSANDFRILCLQSLYRKNIIYSTETLTGAKGLHNKFHNFINDSAAFISGESSLPNIHNEKLLLKLENTKEEVISQLSDDFNTSQALYCLTELIDTINESVQSSGTTSGGDANSLLAIAACSDYVDKILCTLGVNIICKKRLKKEFVHFMDAVNEFRSELKLFAISCQSKTNENKTDSEYIDDIFTSFIKRKNSHYNMGESYEIVSHIVDSVKSTYRQSIVSVVTQNEIFEVSAEIQKQNEKKKRAKLLSLCDELRESLQKKGIAIKDKKEISIWYPTITFKLK